MTPDPSTHDPSTTIVLRVPQSQKGHYVSASRAAGGTLAEWILATLDAAAGAHIPPGPASPGAAPRDGRRRDPEPR